MKDYRLNNLTALEVETLISFNQTRNLDIDVYPLKNGNSTKLPVINNYFINDWRLPINVKGKHGKARKHLAITYGEDGWDLLATNDDVEYYNLKAEYIEKFLKLDKEYKILNRRQRKDIEEDLWISQAFDKVSKGEFTITETKI